MESIWIEALSSEYRDLLLKSLECDSKFNCWTITRITRVSPKFGLYDPNYLHIFIRNTKEYENATKRDLLDAKLVLERIFHADLTWFQTIGTSNNLPRWDQFWIIIRDIDNALSWGRIK